MLYHAVIWDLDDDLPAAGSVWDTNAGRHFDGGVRNRGPRHRLSITAYEVRGGRNHATHCSQPARDARRGREVSDDPPKIAEELPELTARHHQRLAGFDQLAELLKQLKVAREERA